jgi:uncharacterized protein
MNDLIIHFIIKQTCANVCCVNIVEKSPYCFSCFYAFNSEEGLLYFKSSQETQHSKIIASNPLVAGTILPDKLNVLHIKGIQFEGVILRDDHSLAKEAFAQYHKHHPMALAMPGHMWTIRITSIKMTDNSLGFGKKITWTSTELVG